MTVEPALAGVKASFSVKRIVAAGLTYDEHIKQTGEKVDHSTPLLFDKLLRTRLAAAHGGTVRIPSSEEIYRDLNTLDSQLTTEARAKFRNFPAMLDYEGELGLLITRPVRATELDGDFLTNTIAVFTANDLTLRSIQVLADGYQGDQKYQFWTAAKGFAGFLPMGQPKLIEDFALAGWRDFTITTLVDGQVRQSGEGSRGIIYTPRQFLKALAARFGGTIPGGTALLTGSPSNTAFKVSQFKKGWAKFWGYSAIDKLVSASNSAKKNTDFLHSGSRVEVRINNIESHTVTIR